MSYRFLVEQSIAAALGDHGLAGYTDAVMDLLDDFEEWSDE